MAGPASLEKEALPAPVIAPFDNKDSSSQLWMAPSNVFSKAHLMADVDPERSTFPLAAYCFMTGFMCVPSPNARLTSY